MWLVAVSALFTLVTLQLPVSRATFITASTYPAGTSPWTVLVADFNGDGVPDLAVANFGDDGNGAGVSILLGKGDGTFQALNSYVIGRTAYYVAVGDFNGDGHPDLAVSGYDNFGNLAVSILLGNGDGTFGAPQSYVVPSGAGSPVVGDFNGDGIADLVVVGIGGVSILLGNGDGTFQAPKAAAPTVGGSLVVADFNGDGILDLAMVNLTSNGSNRVTILLGNGDGTFRPDQSYAAGYAVQYVVVGDFNGDGILDVAAAYYGNPPGIAAGISILLSNGDGTFQAAQSYTVDSIFGSLRTLTVGDFNGDGHLDLVVAGASVSVLLGRGDGTFQAPVLYAAGSGPRSIAVGDFNGDGVPDLAVADFGSNTVSILLGKGDGTFRAARSYGPRGYAPVVADFNRDGILDVAVTNYFSNKVSILLGNGDGTFQPARSYPLPDFGDSMAAGDFNGDGIPDLVVVHGNRFGNGTVSILLGNGDGTFQPAQTMAAGSGPNFVAVGDFNGDGKLDIVTTNYALVFDPHHPPIIIENGVRVLLGNGDGTFQAAQPIAIQGITRPHFVVVGDFNGDGSLDLAVANGELAPLMIFLGNGDGTFQPARTISLGPGLFAESLVLGDFNGDGHLDLAVACGEVFPGPGGLFVLLGNGDGTFQPAHKYSVGTHPYSVAVADFNRDGIPDAAVANSDGMVSILLGNGDGSFRPPQSYAAGPAGSLGVGDFNGDGFADLVFAGEVTVLLNAADW